MLLKNTHLKIFATLLLLFSFKLALAALPPTLNYQGHLTDSGGAPVNGSLNITFNLYNVSAGGIAVWSESQTVTVNQGMFSVELGSNGSPLSTAMFEIPLWIGLSVATDAEMSPRRPVTTTGYSFKAGDAETVGGISATALDQSSHVSDLANPHNVTAAQTGAADAATLSAHTTNTANPHSVTAAQTGAASSANFIAHTADISAHHAPYTDANAVAAMGATGDGNTLNHIKRSDAQVMSAVTSLDGAGSTLDADLVDGLQASEIIDAAQDEVRTPISTLPFEIGASGSYYLTGNLNGSSGGITIYVDDVTVNLMGFTIDGGGSVNNYGINFSGRSNITIKNGTIKRFGLAGIYQSSTIEYYATVIGVQVLANGILGTSSAHSGMYLRSNNSHVERCTAGDNGGYGIYAYFSSKLINNTAYNNTGAFAIFGENSSTLIGNTAYKNTGTYAIGGGTGVILTGNTAYNNTGTYAIYGSSGAILTGNAARFNTSTYAIYGGSGVSLTDNTAYSNIGTYAIYGNTGATLTGNTVYNNTGWGLYGVGSNLIKDNTLYSNNTGNTAGLGGLRVVSDSRVVGNTLDGNAQNNIVVSGSDNVIKDNHFTDSTNGIYFLNSGNYYRDNTAAGNTTNFNLNSTTQTNGGGNVSF